MSRGLPAGPALVLGVGVAALSTASLWIRLCDAPSLVIAAYRLALASAVLVPVELARSRGSVHELRDLGWCALSGAFLAVHFATWIASLSYTSVAVSSVLVNTTPLFVAALSWALLGERPDRRTAWGAAVATAGAGVIGWSSGTGAGGSLAGAALALAGALTLSAYLILGRRVGPGLGTRTYVTWTYGSAAVLLVAAATAAGLSPGPYPRATYAYLLLLALVPQLVGHTAINWALGRMGAATVAVVALGEPVGATILAAALLGETPSPATVAGGALVLAGIWLAAGGRARGGER